MKKSALVIAFLFGVYVHFGFAQVHVLTQHNDFARTGANLNETILNTFNVSPLGFGKIYEYPVSGQVYAQPLYVSGLDIPGKGKHNVLFIATMHNDVYALDADDASQTNFPFWKVNVGPSVPLPDPNIGKACGNYYDIIGEIGILSTPIIDLSNNTIYVLAKTKENGQYVDRIHALDIITGAAKAGSSQIIQGSVPGTGAGSNNGIVSFLPVNENQRSSLVLSNGIVYVCYAGYCDTPPYHGWIFGYNASNVQEQKIIFNATPNGDEAGIWMAGQAPAVDTNGDLYVITGNGRFNPATKDYGDCFLRLRPENGSLKVVDYFAPYNEAYLDQLDLDLGSDGAMLIPGTNLLTGSGKEGVMYLLNRDDLGKWNLQQDTCYQRIKIFNGHLHGSTVFWMDNAGNKYTYWWSEGDRLKAFLLNNNYYQATPASIGPQAPAGMPGGILSISSSGNSAASGILWVNIQIAGDANHATVDGILRAFDASDVSKEIWNSEQITARDALGKFAKFCAPTIVNGRVYMATFSNKVVVYGIIAGDKLRDPENPGNTVNGLDYKYYEGIWDKLPPFESMQPAKTGQTNLISPAVATRTDNFGLRFSGYIDAPEDGYYVFYLNSDDGSRLYIGDIALVNNDGLHATMEASGRIGLKKGKHAITLDFFEKTGDQVLTLAWEGQGISKQFVPADKLYRINILPDQLIIRPVPSYSRIMVLAGYNIPAGTAYEILNNLGQRIKSGILTGKETQINIAALQAGIYYLHMNSKGKKITERFVKM